MPSSNKKPDTSWLNQTQMAKSLGVSVSAFVKWGVEPSAKIGRTTYYTARSVVDNRIANANLQRNNAAGRAPIQDPEQLDEARDRARLIKEKADNMAIKNAQLRRDLAPIEIIEWALSRVGSQISSVIDSIPAKIKRRVPSMTAPEMEIIKRELANGQNVASKIEIDLDDYYRESNIQID